MYSRAEARALIIDLVEFTCTRVSHKKVDAIEIGNGAAVYSSPGDDSIQLFLDNMDPALIRGKLSRVIASSSWAHSFEYMNDSIYFRSIQGIKVSISTKLNGIRDVHALQFMREQMNKHASLGPLTIGMFLIVLF